MVFQLRKVDLGIRIHFDFDFHNAALKNKMKIYQPGYMVKGCAHKDGPLGPFKSLGKARKYIDNEGLLVPQSIPSGGTLRVCSEELNDVEHSLIWARFARSWWENCEVEVLNVDVFLYRRRWRIFQLSRFFLDSREEDQDEGRPGVQKGKVSRNSC